MVNSETGSAHRRGLADLVLRPDLTRFQLMDFHRGREAIDVGRALIDQVASQLEPSSALLKPP